jgi:hypothetical protein
MQIEWSRLTRKQAEIVAGVSRATLYRRIEDGSLSAAKDERGENRFDAAELARVFKETFDQSRLETDQEMPQETGLLGTVSLPEMTGRPAETGSETVTKIAVLEVENRYLKDEKDQLKIRLAKLEEDLENERQNGREERQRIEAERARLLEALGQQQDRILALTDQREPPVAPEPPPAGIKFTARLAVAALAISGTVAALYWAGAFAQ